MNCKEIENSIWEYVEGLLDEGSAKAVASHLENCEQCASLEKGIRASMLLIDNSRKTEADPFFFTRLEARMEQETEITMPKKSYAIRYAMAASIAFIGIIGGSIFGSYSAERLSTGFANTTNIEQNDELGIDLADNSFDLLKDFE